jgi:CubicO group peptidase (beta-lactamase class C family)
VKAPIRVLGFFAACLLTSAPAIAREAKIPETFDLNQVDSFLAAEVLERGRVGLSVAIVKNGQLVFAKGYGRRSLRDNRPVEPDTLFAIGSVTKQFTCACILLLAQEGKLSVRDKVSKYFPKLTRASDITLLNLMNHTSGYPDYYPLDFVDRRMQKPISSSELVQQYAGGNLDFEPGTNWSYSNTGYILLGRVVEKVSGQFFSHFLEKRILKPLGMTQTSYEPDSADPRLATGYTSFALSAAETAVAEAEGWAGAAGALYSTPSDLAKWDMALIGGKILKPEFYKLMTTSRELSNARVTGYGCGLAVRVQERRTVLSHGGAVSGFNAFNAIVPSTKSAVVLLSNKDGALGSLPEILTTLVLKEESSIPKVAGLPAADAVKKVFFDLQAGTVNRSQFGEEFNLYLSDEKIAGAAKRLQPFGSPKTSEVVRSHERGGMEVTTTRLSFETKDLQVLMYRTPDGKIEQFFVDEE